jgi:hypothetical protein
MSQRRILSLTVCLLVLGCSSLADEDTRPPAIATISGTLTLADGATEVLGQMP